MRLGYAGDDQPRLKIPSTVAMVSESAEHTDMIQESKNPKPTAQTLYGNDLSKDNPNYEYLPIYNAESSIYRADLLTGAYKDYMCPQLSMMSGSFPIVISEPNINDASYRKMVGDFFEGSKTPKIFLFKNAALTLFSCGKSSGVVLESGASRTEVSPIEDGYVQQSTVISSLAAGNILVRDIAEGINNDLLFSGSGFSLKENEGAYKQSFFDFQRKVEAEKIYKEIFQFSVERDK